MYEIDQSGKIEQTARPTVIAFSNGRKGSLLILPKEKQIIQKIYRKAGKPRVFIIQVFSALVYLLIEKSKLNKETVFTIDKEYPKYDSLIKSYIIQLSLKRKRIKILPEQIKFQNIGKKSKAHTVANSAYKKRRSSIKVTSQDVLGLILQYNS